MSARLCILGLIVCVSISSTTAALAAERPDAKGSAEVNRLKQRITILEAKLHRARMEITRRTTKGNLGGRSASAKSDILRQASFADDETRMRALERTLVREGASLLRAGDFEITPSFGIGIASQSSGRHSNLIESRISVSAGLPWASQVSATMPWSFNLSSPSSSIQRGEFELAFSKQLVDETLSAPSVVGTVATGFRSPSLWPNGILGSTGFGSLYGALIATKRLDPLVLYGVLYGRSVTANPASGRDLTLGTRFGTFLAVTPSITATMGLDIAWTSNRNAVSPFASVTEVWEGAVNFGFSAILKRNLMMRVNFTSKAFGDVPQFTATVSFPIMF